MGFPQDLDDFTNPTDTDRLDDPSHPLQHSQVNDAVEEIERSLVGPAFISASTYQDAPSVVVSAAETLSSAAGTWGASGGYLGAVPSLDSSIHSEGASSVTCLLTFPAGTGTDGKMFFNLTTPLSIGGATAVSFDARWGRTGSGSGSQKAFEFVIASGANLTGVVSTVPMSATKLPVEQIWGTIRVPVGSVTTIGSVGIRKQSSASGGNNGKRTYWWLDNIFLAPATGIDRAMGSADRVAVVVPPSYVSAYDQAFVETDPDKGLLDLRPDHAILSGIGGVKNVREWHVDETGETDVTDYLQTIWNSLSTNDQLVFPANGLFRVEGEVAFTLKDFITVDARGARFYRTGDHEDPMFTIGGGNNIFRGFRIFGERYLQDDGSNLVAVAGTPTTSGTSSVLTAQNDEVRIPLKTSNFMTKQYGRTKDGTIKFAFTLSDSAQVAGDCTITVTDHNNTVTYYTTTITLTATPTLYEFGYEPSDLTARSRITVKKATATANSITIGPWREYNEGKYSATYAFDHGFRVTDGHDLLVEDCVVEGMHGDGFVWSTDSCTRVTVRQFLGRCNGRQGVSFNQGAGFLLEDFEIIGSGRHDLDIEPETLSVESVDTVIRDGRFAMGTLGVIASTAFARVRNVVFQNVELEHDAVSGVNWWAGGFDGGGLYNFRVRYTGAGIPSALRLEARNATLDGLQLDGGLELVEDTDLAVGSIPVDTGYNVARNIHVLGGNQTGRLIVGAPHCHVENVTFLGSSAEDVDTDYLLPIQLASDTTYLNFNPTPESTLMPATYKGIAAGQLWFPRGLDLLDDGVLNARALSSSSTRGNNLCGTAVVSAGASTAAVAFGARSDTFNPDSFTKAVLTDAAGTLAAGTYYYRVAGRTVQGGPIVPLAEGAGVTIASPNNAVSVTVFGLMQVASDAHVMAFTIYRGLTSGGPYTQRYDVVPAMDFAGAGHANLGDRVSITDFGSLMSIVPTVNQLVSGYADSYAVSSGSWTGVDESGYEPDANYFVLATPDWSTTVYVSAKTRAGFTLNFGSAAPGGGGNVAWLIVR